MDWLKLFTLLVAVVFISVLADGPKKKILIHLPQKVKHIHHHKKIYITNHPAASQYAPAYTSSGEGTVAVASNILPAVANIVPINSVNLYDERQKRGPNNSPAASQLIPLYHARGYYGPTPNDIEDSEFDIVPSDSAEYVPSVLSSSGVIHSSHLPKRLKIIKLNEPPRKKVVRKVKPKRIIVRNKPQPQSPVEGELPVSTFHEQFYSDLDGTGTVRKLRRPPRIEKIVDGDTEHIHTYNEEHIHKVIFDQGPKVSNVVGVDPLIGMSAIAAAPQRIIPFKGGQSLVALPRHPFAGIAAVGPVVSPTTIEYAAYNPHDVTHDHIFHDHGEIPADLEINKDTLGIPPKVSYNSQGVRISGTHKKNKNKQSQKTKKLSKPTTDFSYYENIYTPNSRPGKNEKPSVTSTSYDNPVEAFVDEYRPAPNFDYKDIHKRPRNLIPAYYDTSSDFRFEQASVSTPFDLSSPMLHEFKPKRYAGAGSTRVLPYLKDTYTNNFEYNSYASPSTPEDKNDSGYVHHTKTGRNKPMSTQNISFRGHDKITWNIEHTDDSRNIDDDDVPIALDNGIFDQALINNDETQKGSSPQAEQLFSLKVARNLNGDHINLPDASNNNYRYAEAPNASTPVYISIGKPSNTFSKSSPTESPKTVNTTKGRRNSETNRQSETRNSYATKNRRRLLTNNRTRSLQSQNAIRSRSENAPKQTGKLKYGDKI